MAELQTIYLDGPLAGVSTHYHNPMPVHPIHWRLAVWHIRAKVMHLYRATEDITEDHQAFQFERTVPADIAAPTKLINQ